MPSSLLTMHSLTQTPHRFRNVAGQFCSAMLLYGGGRYSSGTQRYWAALSGHPALLPLPLWFTSLCSDDGTCAVGTQVPVRLPPPSLQHVGNVKGVGGGVSQPSVHAPVEAPVNGSLHGTQ